MGHHRFHRRFSIWIAFFGIIFLSGLWLDSYRPREWRRTEAYSRLRALAGEPDETPCGVNVGVDLGRSSFFFRTTHGILMLEMLVERIQAEPVSPKSIGLWQFRVLFGGWTRSSHWTASGLRLYNNLSVSQIQLPMSGLVLPLGAAFVFFIRRSILKVRDRSFRSCRKCTYDLRFNESGRCPECGQLIDE